MVGLQLWKEVGDLKSWHLEEEILVKEIGEVTRYCFKGVSKEGGLMSTMAETGNKAGIKPTVHG